MKSHTELLKIIEELTTERQELQYKVDEQGEEIHALKARVTSLEALNDKQKQTLKGRSYKAVKCSCERTGHDKPQLSDKERFRQAMKKDKTPEVFRMKYYVPKGK